MNYIWSLKIILFSIFIFKINGRTSNDVRKTLSDGSKIIGRYQTSFMGRGILAFVGIPYAEPPIGALRFKAPIPKTKWKEPLMTIKDSNKCMQLMPFQVNLTVEGSEDCLYLNVFTPLDANPKYFPVMVFFHGGGGAMANSGSSKEYAPDYLLDHDIVLVTANFRLGPLGFLSSGTQDCTGNFGIKDQLLVLQWVQQNIKIFNGNRNSVTVFGVDAGAASITYLIQSPRTRGLIHRAIIQSGVNMNPWGQPAFEGVSHNRTRTLAIHLNCNYDIRDTEWHETMNCLRRLSAKALTVAFYELYRYEFDPLIPFSPVIESEGPEAIITEDPRYTITAHGRRIPIIIGMNTEEGAMSSVSYTTADTTNSRNFFSIKATWKPNVPYVFNYKRKIRDRIADVYFGNIKVILIDITKFINVTNLYTDSWFLAGIDEYLRKRLLERYATPAGSTYVYLFSHEGSASYTEIYHGGREHYYGACHGDELRALFPVDDHLFSNSIPSDTDTTVRMKMTKMWVNFATTGNPTPNHELGFTWYRTPPTIPINYLRIGNPKSKRLFKMESGLMDTRAKFWYDLQPNLSPDEWQQCAN